MPEESVMVLSEGVGRFRLERIVSRGHSSPDAFWYDQEDDEWVTLLSGEAILKFENGENVILRPGDWIEIPARTRHRVESTSETEDTVWLALHSMANDPTGLNEAVNPV